ncbi:MAG: hypothetical protein V7K62_23020 [Nostoc sp.]
MYLVTNTKIHHILYQEHGDFSSFVRNYKCFYFQLSNCVGAARRRHRNQRPGASSNLLGNS